MQKRHVFFVSDGTGLSAETLGQSLLSQFPDVEFISNTIPYVDTLEKAQNVCQLIEESATLHQQRPLLFATFVNTQIHQLISKSNCLMLDFVENFIGPLENELGILSNHLVGQKHAMQDQIKYKARIDAINFTLKTDDGSSTNHYEDAEVILIGVSRSGKTPTSLYLSLQFGIYVSNYPLTEDDLQHYRLPDVLKKYKNKLFGLTISAEQLIAIRNERTPGSQYASPLQCRKEIKAAMQLYEEENIPFLDSTHLSIEELSTKILQKVGIERRIR